MTADDPRSRFVTATDGLRLHVAEYGAEQGALAVVCLPGLARTTLDFDPLARFLVADRPERRVVALDYRGRGGSDWDADPTRYDLGTEARDILTVLAALGIARALVVGTSRGGLHAMGLAAASPSLLAGVVLNDIGPVLEPVGLARIKGYVGRMPVFRGWTDVVAALKAVAGPQFTALEDADWVAFARSTFVEGADGTLATRYDPALAVNLAALDPARLEPAWDAFAKLRPVPLLVIRGENSDLLSPETAAAMVARHPDAALLQVPGQGHAPLLADTPTLQAVAAFVRRCERREEQPA